MAKKPATTDDLAYLLHYLVAIELWRSGISQNDIAKRLSIGTHAVNEMLKGASRHVETRTDDAE